MKFLWPWYQHAEIINWGLQFPYTTRQLKHNPEVELSLLGCRPKLVFCFLHHNGSFTLLYLGGWRQIEMCRYLLSLMVETDPGQTWSHVDCHRKQIWISPYSNLLNYITANWENIFTIFLMEKQCWSWPLVWKYRAPLSTNRWKQLHIILHQSPGRSRRPYMPMYFMLPAPGRSFLLWVSLGLADEKPHLPVHYKKLKTGACLLVWTLIIQIRNAITQYLTFLMFNVKSERQIHG